MEAQAKNGMANFWDTADVAGYLKAAFLGFPKSGKSTTATLLAIALRRFLSLDVPIAFFDTENGSNYLVPLIEKLTGTKPLVKRSRSFADLLRWAEAVEKSGAIGIADSITHPWNEFLDSYLRSKNAARERNGKRPVARLELTDFAAVKREWNDRWTTWFVNSPLHLIVCGRAGWEWSHEENEETGKKELQKVGVKMKTEGEFGFEPSLLVEMERSQDISGDHPRLIRTATILGDRFGSINGFDGKSITFPSLGDPEKEELAVLEGFRPHLAMLKPGSNPTVNVSSKTVLDVDDNGDAEWTRERRERTIICEEIQAELVRAYPGQSAADKKAKADLIRDAFETGSWTKVETLPSNELRRGLAQIRGVLGPHAQREAFQTASGPASDSDHPY